MLKSRVLNKTIFVGLMLCFGVTDVWGMEEGSFAISSPRRLSIDNIPDSRKLKKGRQLSRLPKARIERSASPVYDRAEILPPHIYALYKTQPEVVELIFDHVESHIPHNDEGTTRWFLTESYEAYCGQLFKILTQLSDSDERAYVLTLVNEETDKIKKEYGRLPNCFAVIRNLSSLSLETPPILLKLIKNWNAKHPFVPFNMRRALQCLQSSPILWMNFYDDLASHFCDETYSPLAAYQAEKVLDEESLLLVIPVVQECMREWRGLDIDVPFHIRLIHLIHIFSKMNDGQREYKEKLFEILMHIQGRRERSYVWTEFYNCTHNQTMKSADFQQVIDRVLDIQKLMPEVETGTDWPNIRKFLYIMNQLPNHQGMMGRELYTALSEEKERKRQKLLDSVYDYALDSSPESSKLPVRQRVLKLELFAALKKVKEDRERANLDLAFDDCEDSPTKN